MSETLDKNDSKFDVLVQEVSSSYDKLVHVVGSRIGEQNNFIKSKSEQLSQNIFEVAKAADTRLSDIYIKIDEQNKKIEALTQSVDSKIDEQNKSIETLSNYMKQMFNQLFEKLDQSEKSRLDKETEMNQKISDLEDKITHSENTKVQAQ